jgi:hypothetical protein
MQHTVAQRRGSLSPSVFAPTIQTSPGLIGSETVFFLFDEPRGTLATKGTGVPRFGKIRVLVSSTSLPSPSKLTVKNPDWPLNAETVSVSTVIFMLKPQREQLRKKTAGEQTP